VLFVCAPNREIASLSDEDSLPDGSLRRIKKIASMPKLGLADVPDADLKDKRVFIRVDVRIAVAAR